MTKPRKYNGAYKIEIHKHTLKRYKRSVWTIGDWIFIGNATMYACAGEIAYSRVSDIRYGLENPLGTGTKYPYRRLDKFVELTDQADWRITPDGDWVEKPKSLLERIKARFE